MGVWTLYLVITHFTCYLLHVQAIMNINLRRTSVKPTIAHNYSIFYEEKTRLQPTVIFSDGERDYTTELTKGSAFTPALSNNEKWKQWKSTHTTVMAQQRNDFIGRKNSHQSTSKFTAPTPVTRIPPPPQFSKNVRATYCPEPFGQFPYVKDCSKFLNCWQGRGALQSCPHSLLFSPILRTCDFARNVHCYTEEQTSDKNVMGRKESLPYNGGQLLRLRAYDEKKYEGPWQGYVEIFRENAWGVLCDRTMWTSGEANIVCRQLGYTRGAMAASKGLTFGRLTRSARVHVNQVKCSGQETHLWNCTLEEDSTCTLEENIISVVCKPNSRSMCSENEIPFQKSCYSFHNDPVTHSAANQKCQKQGGRLVDINSQTEHDFLSEWLSLAWSQMNMQFRSFLSSWHTGGVRVAAINKYFWVWEGSPEGFSHKNWYPAFDPDSVKGVKCVSLDNVLRAHTNIYLPYYFFNLTDCDAKKPFICEVERKEIGCRSGNGIDYRGDANTTTTGKPCLAWTNENVLAAISRSSNEIAGIGNHSFCRNPDGDTMPWCFIANDSPQNPMFETCDIPKCGKTSYVERGPCKLNEFHCQNGECIYSSKVCNEEKDCSNGLDEKFCNHYLEEFSMTPETRLDQREVERWLHLSLDTCARRCRENKNFQCIAFNYHSEEEKCFLLDVNVQTGGGSVPDNDFDYYELTSSQIDCSGLYVCSDGKCINNTQVCDMHVDCHDGSDESKCEGSLNIKLRLVNGSSSHDGRVQIQVYGRWGTICDDLFGINEANVICHQLGYSLGAREAIPGASYGTKLGPIFMDDVNCVGNETSIADCEFPGWGKSDCDPAEAAGVYCNIPGEKCADDHWMCASSECIPVTYLCDDIKDCKDGSDENKTMCKAPLEVRLVGGPDERSGRVEVKQYGIWGTICDDGFTVEDAKVICRMLGFEGAPVALKEAYFGSGSSQIWLDELQCIGNETCLLQCGRLPWGQHNCQHSEDAGIRCIAHNATVRAKGKFQDTPKVNIDQLLPRDCGLRMVEDKPLIPLQIAKIISGQFANPGAYPWQASIRYRSGVDGTHYCGAAVIGEYHVLTAAHCMTDFPKGSYLVRVGDYNNQELEPEEDEFDIDELFVHEFNNDEVLHNNDLALIRVKSKRGHGIKFGTFVQPICLPTAQTQYQPGLNCTISGWGSTGISYSYKLRAAAIPILDLNICKSPNVYGDKIKPGMICAGYLEGGIDSCQGDSGGPLVHIEDGRHVLYGIISWGHGCARPNKPGVYVKLSYYLDWIAEKVAKTTY